MRARGNASGPLSILAREVVPHLRIAAPVPWALSKRSLVDKSATWPEAAVTDYVKPRDADKREGGYKK